MDENLRPYFFCMDCGKDTLESHELYSLPRPLWRKINPVIARMLCLDCAERRLGRELAAADFSKAPINTEQAAICPALALRLIRSNRIE